MRGSRSVFISSLLLLLLLITTISSFLAAQSYDGPIYDYSAYTECKASPEHPLYNGGILKDPSFLSIHQEAELSRGDLKTGSSSYTRAILLRNLSPAIYTFSAWVTLNGSSGAEPVLVRATLQTENETQNCIGSVLAKSGCWSFLKGGFLLKSTSESSLLYLQDFNAKNNLNIEISSVSLQPFTDEEWKWNQEEQISKERQRYATIHVSGAHGERLRGASISISQISSEFPFGSAIADTILDNPPYQEWFLKRFNAAVFENELKWYATEPTQGKTNYTLADQMLSFLKSNSNITSIRGHNIFWEDPIYTPKWVKNLTNPNELTAAVTNRINSLMSKYRGEFIHWDVSNELLHFNFYEQRLGPNATLNFFKHAHSADPRATLFLNEFNVVETCGDGSSSVDGYVERVRELWRGGVEMDGIGIEGHFGVPNPGLIRAGLDKLGVLGLPIWLTEIDVSRKIGVDLQGVYLEQILREGYSHPAVKGIVMWTAMHPGKVGGECYQMCLTDKEMRNLPAGDVVDKLVLGEWRTGVVSGVSDEFGSFDFHGFLGEYHVTVDFQGRRSELTISLDRGDETKHFNVNL